MGPAAVEGGRDAGKARARSLRRPGKSPQAEHEASAAQRWRKLKSAGVTSCEDSGSHAQFRVRPGWRSLPHVACGRRGPFNVNSVHLVLLNRMFGTK